MTYQHLTEIPVEKLQELLSRSALTLDGLWFLAAEEKYGLEAAIELDTKVWERFMPIHAKRVARTFGVTESGISGLAKVFELDPLWVSFKPEVERLADNGVVLRMTDCPPQRARVRDGRGEFPCKPVGIACFAGLLQAFAPEAKVSCLVCPPDPHPAEVWCAWKFEI